MAKRINAMCKGPIWGLLALLLTLPAVGQETVEEVSSVVLVEVPVQVVSRDGTPVDNLTVENFELQDRRDEKPILAFERVDLRDETEEPVPVSARRHLVLFFDLANSDPVAIRRARDAAIEILQGSLNPQDMVAVATFSRIQGLRLLVNFTTAHGAVAQAILEQVQGEGMGSGLDVTVGAADAAPGGGRGGGRGAEQSFADVENRLAQSSDRGLEVETLAQMEAMSALAGALTRLDGRKQILYLSRGLDLQIPPATLGTDVETGATAVDRNAWTVGSEEVFGSTRLQSASEEMVAAFRRADCAIYPVDISMQRSGNALSSDSRRTSLVSMAKGTGGEFYGDFNDLGVAVNRMLERTSVTYLLAFQPDDLEGSGEFRKLRVKLRNVPGRVRVSHREGYFDRIPEVQPEQVQMAMTAASAGAPEPPPAIFRPTVPLEVLAVPIPAPVGTQTQVAILLKIPGESVLDAAEGQILAIDVDLEASSGGAKVASHQEGFGIDVEAVRATLEGGGIVFYGAFRLPDGDYVVQAGARLGGELHVGVTQTRVTVGGERGISAPLFPEPVGRWALARQEGPEQGEVVEFAFAVRGETFVPAVHPELHGDLPATFCLLPRGIEGDDLDLLGEIRTPQGELVRPAEVILLERTGQGPDGLDCLIGELRPGGLAAGEYRLAISVSDPLLGETVASAEIPVSVAARESRLSGIPGFPHLFAVSPEAMMARIDEDQVTEDYLGVLARLAGGDGAGARFELMRLEESVLTPSGIVPEALSRVEERAANRLARKRLDSLVPILQLHAEAYEAYRVQSRIGLAVHSRHLLGLLADRYAKKARSAEDRAVGAGILTRLAGYVAQAGAHSVAEKLFKESLDLDPRNDAAALGHAALLEKRGEYEQAIRVLEDYRKAGGRRYEAGLRLAMSLARVEKQDEALRLLRKLIDEPDGAEEWMSALAYQELGQLLLDRGRDQDAVELLSHGVETHPEDPTMGILLTYAQDRGRRAGSGQRLLGHLQRGAGHLSPRYLYNQWPEAVFEANESRLEAEAGRRLDTLAQALGRRSEGAAS